MTQPEAEDVTLGERAEQAAIGAGVGAAVGAAAPRVITAFGKGLDSVRNRFARGVNELDEFFGAVAGGADDIQLLNEVQEQVGKKAGRQMKEISSLFRRATQEGRRAIVSKQPIDSLKTRITATAEEFIDDDSANFLRNVLTRVNGLGDSATVNDLEVIRRAATNASQRLPAAGRVKALIDDVLIEASEKGQIKGKEGAVRLWKSAIAKRRDFANRFENPKTVALAATDEITPEQLSQRLFGAGSITTARGAGKEFDAVVRALGPDSKPLLKQAAIGKIIRFAGRDAADDQVWLQRLSKEISNLRKQNPSLWNKFDEKERQLLSMVGNEAEAAARGGPINRVIDATLDIMNWVFRRGGFRTSLRLPSTLEPKQMASMQDVLNLVQTKPEIQASVITRLGTRLERFTEDDVLANQVKDIARRFKQTAE